jgi:hypothetical protein
MGESAAGNSGSLLAKYLAGHLNAHIPAGRCHFVIIFTIVVIFWKILREVEEVEIPQEDAKKIIK